MKNKKILIIVTGSIAAYKTCEVVRLLRKEGTEVQVMMSKSAQEFVGKTTFARCLINNLQKKNNIEISHVLSPTFNIVYDYDVKSHKIMHYDLYRLKSEIEIKQLGIFEDPQKTVKIIEWPELIKINIKNKLEISFSYSDKVNTRSIKISGIGKWKNFKIN